MEDNEMARDDYYERYAKCRTQILIGLIRLRKQPDESVYYLEGFDDAGDLDGYEGMTQEELARDFELYLKEADGGIVAFGNRLAELATEHEKEEQNDV